MVIPEITLYYGSSLHSEDPSIQQRINETATEILAQIQEVQALLPDKIVTLLIEAIKQHQVDHYGFKRGLPNKLRKQLTDSDNHNLDTLFTLFFYLGSTPRSIGEQINMNRHSIHVKALRRFFSDSKIKNDYNTYSDYWYDDGLNFGGKYPRIDESKRIFRDLQEVKNAVYETIKTNGSLTLYDTSDPRLQPVHSIIIDILKELGLVEDFSSARLMAAMVADTGLDIHALDQFANTDTWDRKGYYFIDPEWLRTTSDDTVNGFLRIEGKRKFPTENPNIKTNSRLNPQLSALCQKLKIDTLFVDLMYTRSGSDIKLVLEFNQNLDNIIDVDSGTSLII